MNWQEIQKLYDGGLSWRDLLKIGYSYKALVWARKNDKLRTRSNKEGLRLAYKLGKKSGHSIFHKEQCKNNGGYRKNSGRCKTFYYIKKDGLEICLQGSWELIVAKFLDDKKCKWNRNKIGFKYIFENKERTYFPDFYLDDLKLYIEVKGFETEKDKAKWSQFIFPLSIIKKNEIKNLDLWYSSLKTSV